MLWSMTASENQEAAASGSAAGTQRIVVVGAGILGASIGLNLAEQGVEVTVLEAETPGAGTTSTSYAWVNSNGKEPESYYAINRAGLLAHREFAAAPAGRRSEGAETWFLPTGHLEIAADAAHEEDVRRRAEALKARGHQVEELSAEQLRELEPGLILPERPRAMILFPEEAYLYPLRYLAEALHRLRQAGGMLRTGARVTGFAASDAGGSPSSDSSAAAPVMVQLQDGRSLEADQVVLAAGRWTGELAAAAGAEVPLAEFQAPGDVTVGYLARTTAVPHPLQRLLTSAWLNARPDGGGRLLLQALDLDVTADPGDVPGPDSELAAEFLRRLRAVLPDAAGAQIEEIVVGQRVMPADGKTIASPVPGVPWMYAVATHSGVTLAPFLGRAVAAEVLGHAEPLLEDFRLERFREGVPAEPPRGPRKPGGQ